MFYRNFCLKMNALIALSLVIAGLCYFMPINVMLEGVEKWIRHNDGVSFQKEADPRVDVFIHILKMYLQSLFVIHEGVVHTTKKGALAWVRLWRQ